MYPRNPFDPFSTEVFFEYHFHHHSQLLFLADTSESVCHFFLKVVPIWRNNALLLSHPVFRSTAQLSQWPQSSWHNVLFSLTHTVYFADTLFHALTFFLGFSSSTLQTLLIISGYINGHYKHKFKLGDNFHLAILSPTAQMTLLFSFISLTNLFPQVFMSLRQCALFHKGVIISALFNIVISTKDIYTCFVVNNVFLVIYFDVFPIVSCSLMKRR